MSGIVNREEEFRELYERMWTKVYRYLYYLVQNREEAEELAQEAFGKVYVPFKQGALDPSRVESYLYRSAKNLVIDRWRQKGRKTTVIPMEDLSRFDADRQQEQRITDAMVLKRAMKNLKQVEVQVITMRIIEGYSVRETAERLGRAEGTIKSIQFRALAKLKDLLKEGEGFHDQ